VCLYASFALIDILVKDFFIPTSQMFQRRHGINGTTSDVLTGDQTRHAPPDYKVVKKLS
jgi:hypothetical protein